MTKANKKIFIVAGPTASGKTGYAINLALKSKAEVINADSLQIYKENPILSAQPTNEEKQGIKHHLFGYIDGEKEYNIAKWLNDSVNIINNLEKPILVGGTGFFLKHLIFGLSTVPDIPLEVRNAARNLLKEVGAEEFYKILKAEDSEVAQRLDPNNTHRTLRAYEVIKATSKSINFWQMQKPKTFFPVENFKLIILLPEKEILYKKCNERFLNMLDCGALEEVKHLMKQNYNPVTGVMKTHGVPELIKHLQGSWSLEQAIEKSQQVVRNYAKRQITWFKHQFNHSELEVEFIK